MDNKVDYGTRIRVSSSDWDDVGGAILEVEKDKATDLIFHTKARKLFYVLSGKLKVNILRDAQVANQEVHRGESFMVPPGLIYQLVGTEQSIVVEFSSTSTADPNADVHVVSKGIRADQLNPPKPGQYALMSDEDKKNVEAEKAPAPASAAKPVAKKKAATKKRATRVTNKTKVSGGRKNVPTKKKATGRSRGRR